LKKILFLGTKDKSDLVMYIALLQSQLGVKTLIVDGTNNHKYLHAYTRFSDKSLIYDFFNIDIAAAGSWNELEEVAKKSKESLSDYECILIDLDHVKQKSTWPDCDDYYYVFSHEKLTLIEDASLLNNYSATNNISIELKKFTYLIDCDVDEEYLDQLIDNKFKWSSSHHLVPFDEFDISNKVNMQYNMKPTFKRLSKAYKKALAEMVTNIIGNHEKETKSAMKQIEKGVIV
jgi:hypothetical protein